MAFRVEIDRGGTIRSTDRMVSAYEEYNLGRVRLIIEVCPVYSAQNKLLFCMFASLGIKANVLNGVTWVDIADSQYDCVTNELDFRVFEICEALADQKGISVETFVKAQSRGRDGKHFFIELFAEVDYVNSSGNTIAFKGFGVPFKEEIK